LPSYSEGYVENYNSSLFSALNARVVLAAIGQAFYATGVGGAIMIAYGAYVPPGTSLIRTSWIVSGAIVLVSMLATLMVFPLVFHYGMDPAQGPQLVFELLPRAFAEMPGGRLIGTLFFLLLVLAALVPSIALLEPSVAWLIQRYGIDRIQAVRSVAAVAWMLGIGSVLSFNVAADWHPLGFIPAFKSKTFFDVLDFVSSDILLPAGAFLTSIFMGWRARNVFSNELAESSSFKRRVCIWLLRYACPLAILGVFVAALATDAACLSSAKPIPALVREFFCGRGRDTRIPLRCRLHLDGGHRRSPTPPEN
jgi:NSS family neurotransmitter:Na+ symporter